MSDKNLHQRLLAVMGEVRYVAKDHTMPGAVGGYKVVTHDKVTSIVRPALVEQGVVYYPVGLKYTQENGCTQVQLTVRFANTDNPEDHIDVPSLGFGVDKNDKGPGKAISYAVKYALLKTLGLETGEDADLEASPGHEPQAVETKDKAAPPAGGNGNGLEDLLVEMDERSSTTGSLTVWYHKLTESQQALMKPHYDERLAELKGAA